MPDTPKRGTWWSKRKAPSRDDQPPACSQPDNNPPPEQAPAASNAQPPERRDTQPPKPLTAQEFVAQLHTQAAARVKQSRRAAKPEREHKLGPENNAYTTCEQKPWQHLASQISRPHRARYTRQREHMTPEPRHAPPTAQTTFPQKIAMPKHSR